MGLLVHAFEVRLAGKGDQRGAIQERVGDGGDQVGRARAEGPEAHTGSARESADCVGHVGAALLMANGHELNRGGGEGFAQIKRLLTGYSEYVANTLGFKALDEHLRRFALNSHHHHPIRKAVRTTPQPQAPARVLGP